MALILSLSILDGFESKLQSSARKFVPDVNIMTEDNSYIKLSNDYISKLKNLLPKDTKFYASLSIQGLIKKSNLSHSIILKSIDTTGFSDIKDFVLDNFDFNNLKNNEIIISKFLSEQLKLKIGDFIILFIPINSYGEYNDFKVNKLLVKGLYHSGMTQYDESLVFANQFTAAGILNISNNKFNAVHIKFSEPSLINTFKPIIDVTLDYPFYNYSVYEAHQQIFSWIDLQKKPIPIILTSISIIAVLNIITTLLVLVLEKIKTIGIIRSIGLNRSSVLKLILFKAGWLAGIGVALGCVFSLLFSYIQIKYNLISLDGSIYFIDSLPIVINPIYYVLIGLMTLVLAVIVALIPAYISMKTNIIYALKFN